MTRIIHIGASFGIVLVLYWTYSLFAVPLIEPSVDSQRQEQVSKERLDEARGAIRRRLTELNGLFPEGSWELENPKILESDQVKLLLRDYTNLGGGRVKIQPCTMIFVPDGPPTTEAERRRRAVILQAPKGALLEFDQTFDLRRARIGRLKGGQLMGPITIRSNGKSAGTEDDLLVVTREVQLAEDHIWTPHPVDFRLGPNYGRGRQMYIKLMSDREEDDTDTHRPGPSIVGIESFEVSHLEKLHLEFGHLEPGGAELSPRTKSREEKGDRHLLCEAPEGPSGQKVPVTFFPAGAVGKARADANLPIEITCRGPFRFDLVRQVATFEDHVDLLRAHPDGPSDQLNCEMLSIHFDRRADGTSAKSDSHRTGPEEPPANPLDLQAKQIEAQGDPVVVRAPSKGVEARGERLLYDLQSGLIRLDGSREVFLKQGANEIHARSLQYEPAEGKSLGQVLAEGPGWLRGQIAERPAERLEARWNKQLQVHPDEENQLISLTGGTELNYRGIGRLKADEIHFWLLESAPVGKSDKPQLKPDRMLARREVHIQSPQLSGAVDQLEIWFNQDESKAEVGGRKSEGGKRKAEGGGTGGGLGESLSLGQHFEIVGSLLRAKVNMWEGSTELSELTVKGNVRFTETRTARPDEKPLAVRGDLLHVTDASKPCATVTVTGRPAHFEGRGLGLTGEEITLDRGTNRLSIDGAGQMDLAIDRDLEGHPVRDAGPLEVTWKHHMQFDGRKAVFEEEVVATTPHQNLRTETLQVSFKRPILFSESKKGPGLICAKHPPGRSGKLNMVPFSASDPRSQPRPELHEIVCRGGALMENRSFDEAGPLSIDQIEVVNLAINLDSGVLSAAGPGWVTSRRRGSVALAPKKGPGLICRNGPEGASHKLNLVPFSASQTAQGDSADSRLTYLNVRFQGSISGNVHNRTMTFHDQVRTVYGPIDSWQATLAGDDPDALGPRGILLSCDQLSVSDMAMANANRRAVELEAKGNTLVEGRTFTARAVRITYAEAKDLLILEGDGRTDAEIFRQEHLGGPTSKAAARKILYWPSTKRLKVDGARSLELGQFGPGGAAKPQDAARK